MSIFQGVLDKTRLEFDDSLDQAISRELKSTKYTISVAESVTCGLLAQRLTRFPGSSVFFQTGLICYTPISKIQFCGLSPAVLQKYGDMNSVVALEMAKGLQQKTKSNIVISTTGLLGPVNSKYDASMIGTVFIGLVFDNIHYSRHYKFKGSREVVQQQAQVAALVHLKQMLTNEKMKKKELLMEENKKRALDFAISQIEKVMVKALS